MEGTDGSTVLLSYVTTDALTSGNTKGRFPIN